MDTPIFIISGSYHEYFEFLRLKGLPRKNVEYVFISDPMRLHGRQDIQVLCVGQYRQSPVYTNIWLKAKKNVRHVKFVNEHGAEV